MFADSENVSLMNSVKNLIQKEEYISLAINKYILQTAKIPKDSDNNIDWDILKTDDYLGTNFNTTNPITSSKIIVKFDSDNNAYMQGVLEDTTDYDTQYNYLYNFYANKIFRVNTIPPTNITKEKLLIGSQVLYNDIQKEIVTVLNNTGSIKFPNSQQVCTKNSYFYELYNSKLTYKYCKSDNTSFDVYQEEPIYVEDSDDLEYIRASIGTKAYVKSSTNTWSEKYFTNYNDSDEKSEWTNNSTVSEPSTELEDGESIQSKILSYIPNSKDLMLRRDGGCMLANGDIFCWGNNQYKKAGIENYGQLDNTLTPYFLNTPVMLKTQIDSTLIGGVNPNTIKWYNNPYRIKFQKMAMNSTNVCGISPIFTDTSSNKYDGDLYCNGKITSGNYENITSGISETSILSKNRYFSTKTLGIYLTEVAMVEDTIAVLSDAGKIYTIGRNYLGALGINSTDKFIIQLTPVEVTNTGQIFKKIFALRDLKTFGAIDSNNNFYIWGERPNGMVYYKPSLIASGKEFDADAIFTNSKEFLLKGTDGVFYRTTDDLTVRAINSSDIPSNAISASIYDSESSTLYLYATNKLELKGSDSFLTCKEVNGTTNCTSNSEIFTTSLSELNTISDSSGYANFTNVSIYQLDTIKTYILEDYEDGKSTGWTGSSNNYSTSKPVAVTNISDNGDTTRIAPTSFLGRFSMGNGTGYSAGHSYIEKTFSLGSDYANDEVEFEFDFYEIDTWDYEKFFVTLNDEKVVEDMFVHDNHPRFVDDNDTGQYLQPIGASGSSTTNGDETYHYKIKTKLDSLGKLKVRFTTRGLTTADEDYYSNAVAQGIGDESWGIDNVYIKVKETSKTFVCAMTGLTTKSQMYCWGNVGRSIPILNTSLYDVSTDGVKTMNKLFISKESDKTTQMSFDKYSNDGNLFLRYPTYIGGFDYPFYFR